MTLNLFKCHIQLAQLVMQYNRKVSSYAYIYKERKSNRETEIDREISTA